MGLQDLPSGSKLVPGLCSKSAYELDGSALLSAETSKLLPSVGSIKSLSIVTTMKLKQGNRGHLFTIYSPDAKPVMALRANPLAFEYAGSDGAAGSLNLQVNIDDGQWHLVAIAIDEVAVELLVDCKSATRLRRPTNLDLAGLSWDGLTVLGRRLVGNTNFQVTILHVGTRVCKSLNSKKTGTIPSSCILKSSCILRLTCRSICRSSLSPTR